MNVLITSAGRRNYLVEYFKAALGGAGLVMAADASPHASALYAADRRFLVPAADEDGHTDALLDVCAANEVALLVSVNDMELPALAASKALFATIGTHVLVSDPGVIRICHDKLLTAEFLATHGVESPRTVASAEEARSLVATGELHFPLAVKPRFGSASVGFEIVDDDVELSAALTVADARARRSQAQVPARPGVSRVVVQELLVGSEYGLDVLSDLQGRYVATAVKRKLSMRAGETDRAVTVSDDRLETVGATIGRALHSVGVLDCDLIVSDDRACVIDMNPRFGGGYPFSHVAGINMPAAILAWLRGETPDPRWFRYRPDVASAKYDMLMPIGGELGRPERTAAADR